MLLLIVDIVFHISALLIVQYDRQRDGNELFCVQQYNFLEQYLSKSHFKNLERAN
jgi:hypothetical protein